MGRALREGQDAGNVTGSTLVITDFPDSGAFVDPEDKRFALAYAFEGSRISSKDMFTAVLDGLAIIAQIGPTPRCEQLHAFGPLSTFSAHLPHVITSISLEKKLEILSLKFIPKCD